MCIRCAQWLDGLCLPHEPDRCPLQQAFYCSVCALYGHEMGRCTTPWVMRNATDAVTVVEGVGAVKTKEKTRKEQKAREQGMFQKAKQQGRRLVFLPSQ